MKHAMTWINFENTCSVKEARHKRVYVVGFHLRKIPQRGKSVVRNQIRGEGRGQLGMNARGLGVYFWGDEHVLEGNGGAIYGAS